MVHKKNRGTKRTNRGTKRKNRGTKRTNRGTKRKNHTRRNRRNRRITGGERVTSETLDGIPIEKSVVITEPGFPPMTKEEWVQLKEDQDRRGDNPYN